jgi:hypothetical protein
VEKAPIPASKVERFFEKAGSEFQISPARHNRELLLELKKVATLKEIRDLLIDVRGKRKSPEGPGLL